MAVSVTGPRAVNELGGPVIPGTLYKPIELIPELYYISDSSTFAKFTIILRIFVP